MSAFDSYTTISIKKGKKTDLFKKVSHLIEKRGRLHLIWKILNFKITVSIQFSFLYFLNRKKV